MHRMQANCLFRAFSAWAARTRHKAAVKQLLLKAVIALKNGQLLRCWAAWLDYTDARLAAKARLLSAVSHWKGHAVITCFRHWKEELIKLRGLQSKGKDILERILNMLKVICPPCKKKHLLRLSMMTRDINIMH